MAKTKTTKAKTKVGIKNAQKVEPVKVKKPVGQPPKQIKMLMNLASPYGTYSKGSTYSVPKDVPVDTARSWVGCGVAEKVS